MTITAKRKRFLDITPVPIAEHGSSHPHVSCAIPTPSTPFGTVFV
jgi:hypothetical protein